MSIIDTLITDRSTQDLDAIASLNRIKWADMTAQQKSAWQSDSKGVYNISDLNRVGAACAYVYDILQSAGYDVPGYTTPKTNWTNTDIPTAAQLNAYIANVNALKTRLSLEDDTPTTIQSLTISGANNIEKLLIAVDDTLTRLQSAYWYSGEIQAGEE